MHLGNGAERNRLLLNLIDFESGLLDHVLSQIERKERDLPAMQTFVEGMSKNLGDVFVSHFAGSHLSSVRRGARTRRSTVNAGNYLLCSLVSVRKITGIHSA